MFLIKNFCMIDKVRYYIASVFVLWGRYFFIEEFNCSRISNVQINQIKNDEVKSRTEGETINEL
jgi:hypothetical protein